MLLKAYPKNVISTDFPYVNFEEIKLKKSGNLTTIQLHLAARDFLKDVEDLSQLRLTNKTQTPLNKSKLSEYFNHQKGKVKKGYTVDELRKFCNLK